MKKYTYKYIVATLLAVLLISCDLDINENPSFQSDAQPDMLIPSGIAWSSASLGSDVQLVGGIWAQHYAQNNSSNQYTNYDSYNITNASFNRVWLSYYAGALPDLYLARTKSEETSEWGYWIISQVMIAFNYHVLVDLHETIPYSQAVNVENYPAPKYDEGKAINASIIALLDDVIAKENAAEGKSSLGERDLVFRGSIRDWVRFAKTLKLKILIRNFDANKAAIQTLLADGDFLTVDARVNGFIDRENNSNPLYENDRRKLNTTNNIKASATLMTYLKTYSDPRLTDYFEPSVIVKDDDGTVIWPVGFRGLPQGGYTIAQTILPSASISKAALAPTDPVYLVSVAESEFLQAECYARLGDKTKAKASYDKGVTAAFARWNHQDLVSGFLSGAYKFDDSSLDKMLESIIMQKWVASVRCQAWDAFFDINRTGYPKLGTEFTVESDWLTPNPNYVVGMLTPSLNSVLGAGKFPKRFLIPKNSSDNNFNAPAVIPITTKMWWHK